MTTPQEIHFESNGQRCAADLYWPDAPGRVPCIVMAHGGSGTKRLGLPKYALKLAAHGMAALVFDYRHFGESEGEPRQVIDVAAQRADYTAAISCARAQPRIDPQRIALWGTSLSGGHVLAVAASEPTLAAVVSQVPMIDGWHRGRNLQQRVDREVLRRTLQFTAAALRDLIQARLGLPPYLVPVVAKPGRLAVFTEPDAKAAFDALGGESTGWSNLLAPRFLFALPHYERGTAERIAMPLLMCLADRDLQASSSYAANVAARVSTVDIRHYPCGHFDVYSGGMFEKLSDAEVAFLSKHLRVGSSTAQISAATVA